MVEWSITAVLKTAALRGAGGSNPSLSANDAENQRVRKLPPKLPPKMVILGVNFAPTFIHRYFTRLFQILPLRRIHQIYPYKGPDNPPRR